MSRQYCPYLRTCHQTHRTVYSLLLLVIAARLPKVLCRLSFRAPRPGSRRTCTKDESNHNHPRFIMYVPRTPLIKCTQTHAPGSPADLVQGPVKSLESSLRGTGASPFFASCSTWCHTCELLTILLPPCLLLASAVPDPPSSIGSIQPATMADSPQQNPQAAGSSWTSFLKVSTMRPRPQSGTTQRD